MSLMSRISLAIGFALVLVVSTAHSQSISMEFDLSPELEAVLEQVEAGDLDGAEDAMDDLERDFENSAEYHFVLGQIDVLKVSEASALRAPFIARSMRKNWEKSLEIDPEYEPASFSLAMFHTAAPGIVGGDKDEAQRLLIKLQELDSKFQYPLNVTMIGLSDSDTEEQRLQRVENLTQAFDEWATAEPAALTPRVSGASMLINEREWEQAEAFLQEADNVLAQMEEPESGDIHGVSYQWGKYAALSGRSLEQGRDRLLSFMELEETPDSVHEGFVHFRLAQIFGHMNLEQAKQMHLAQAQELAEDDEQLQSAIDNFLLEGEDIAG